MLGSPPAKAFELLQDRLRPIFAAATGDQVGHDMRNVLLHPRALLITISYYIVLITFFIYCNRFIHLMSFRFFSLYAFCNCLLLLKDYELA